MSAAPGRSHVSSNRGMQGEGASVNPHGLPARNRRTAARLVIAALLFHSLALGAGVWVLRQATRGTVDRVPAPVVAQTVAAPVASNLPVPASTLPQRADLPDWVLQARRSDATALWRVDERGHVLLDPGR